MSSTCGRGHRAAASTHAARPVAIESAGSTITNNVRCARSVSSTSRRRRYTSAAIATYPRARAADATRLATTCRSRSVRGVGNNPARLTLASVIEHFEERCRRGRLDGVGDDRIHANTVAGCQVPRVRGSRRTVAVMKESAHAALWMQPGRRARSIRELAARSREVRSFFRTERGRNERFLERIRARSKSEAATPPTCPPERAARRWTPGGRRWVV